MDGVLAVTTHHILSVGGGGMLTVSVPSRWRSSTLSMSGVLDTPFMARFTYLFSVACWKYLLCVNLSTRRSSFLPVLPPDALRVETVQLINRSVKIIVQPCRDSTSMREKARRILVSGKSAVFLSFSRGFRFPRKISCRNRK